MPIYEYRCTRCGKHSEFLEPLDAPEKRDCSVCGRVAKRVPSTTPAAIRFKGSGWPSKDLKQEAKS